MAVARQIASGTEPYGRHERAATPDAALAVIGAEAARYGYRALAIGAPPNGQTFAPFFHSTWPQAWLDVYQAERLAGDDPVPIAAARLRAPFTWAELREGRTGMKLTAAHLRVMDIGEAHGWLGGFVVPIHGPGGYVAAASFAGEARSLAPVDRAALRSFALAAHDRLFDLHVTTRRRGEAALTPREIEALGHVVAGLGDSAVAAQMGVSARTARFHIDNARGKLHCRTRAQLAAAARALGLLDR